MSRERAQQPAGPSAEVEQNILGPGIDEIDGDRQCGTLERQLPIVGASR